MVTISSNINFKNPTEISDAEYSKYFNEYKKHCEGCRDKHMGCSEQAVINCYLHTLLPRGLWGKAFFNDTTNKLVNQLSESINKKLIEEINNGNTDRKNT